MAQDTQQGIYIIGGIDNAIPNLFCIAYIARPLFCNDSADDVDCMVNVGSSVKAAPLG